MYRHLREKWRSTPGVQTFRFLHLIKPLTETHTHLSLWQCSSLPSLHALTTYRPLKPPRPGMQIRALSSLLMQTLDIPLDPDQHLLLHIAGIVCVLASPASVSSSFARTCHGECRRGKNHQSAADFHGPCVLRRKSNFFPPFPEVSLRCFLSHSIEDATPHRPP